jgi:hypothetical protein
MAVLTFDRTYSLDKFMHVMESLNTDTEIQHYYQQLYQTTYDTLGSPDTTNTSDLAQAIHTIHKQNIHVIQNKSFSRTETASSSDHATSSTILNFKGYPIPVDTNLSEIQHLWGAHYTSDPNAMALICTDGSTNLAHPVEGSGAAFIVADDTLHRHEYDNTAASWVIGYSDNYAAELSALNGAIRSVPSTVHLTVYTDSLSAKQALERYIHTGWSTPPLLCSGRPYLIAAAKAIQTRTLHGAKTLIEHVKSHTGTRDLQSIGNEAADRHAKHAQLTGSPHHNINLMVHELPFVAAYYSAADKAENRNPYRPIHGNIRSTYQKILQDTQFSTWGYRTTRGQIPRRFPAETRALIRDIWKAPTSTTLTMLIDILNHADPIIVHTDGTIGTPLCTRCGLNTEETTLHRLVDCPSVQHLWVSAAQQIKDLLRPITISDPQNTITARAHHHHQNIALTPLSTRIRPGHRLPLCTLPDSANTTFMAADTEGETHIAELLAYHEAITYQHTNAAILLTAKTSARAHATRTRELRTPRHD